MAIHHKEIIIISDSEDETKMEKLARKREKPDDFVDLTSSPMSFINGEHCARASDDDDMLCDALGDFEDNDSVLELLSDDDSIPRTPKGSAIFSDDDDDILAASLPDISCDSVESVQERIPSPFNSSECSSDKAVRTSKPVVDVSNVLNVPKRTSPDRKATQTSLNGHRLPEKTVSNSRDKEILSMYFNDGCSSERFYSMENDSDCLLPCRPCPPTPPLKRKIEVECDDWYAKKRKPEVTDWKFIMAPNASHQPKKPPTSKKKEGLHKKLNLTQQISNAKDQLKQRRRDVLLNKRLAGHRLQDKLSDSEESLPAPQSPSTSSTSTAAAAAVTAAMAKERRNMMLKPNIVESKEESKAKSEKTKSTAKPAAVKINWGRLIRDYRFNVLSWQPSWLEEQKRCPKPPVLTQLAIQSVPLTFNCLKDYKDTLLPLLWHETWSSIYQSYAAKEKSGSLQFHVTGCRIQYLHEQDLLSFDLTGIGNKLPHACLLSLECEAAVPCKSPVMLEEHDVVIVHLALDSKEQRRSVFGCIHSTQPRRVRDASTLPFLPGVAPDEKYFLLKFQLFLKYRPSPIHNVNEMIQMDVVSSLVTLERQLRGLIYVAESPIATAILNPVKELQLFCSTPLSDAAAATTTTTIAGQGEAGNRFNPAQTQVIQMGVQLARSEQPRIQLIQGPPGTGKSHTIIGMIDAVFQDFLREGRRRPHILLCAPSNAACDELFRRLIEERQQNKEHRVPFLAIKRIVRLGQLQRIHEDCRVFSVERLVERNMKTEETQHKKPVLQAGGQPQRPVSFCKRAVEKRHRRDVILNADVLCATLNSSGKLFQDVPETFGHFDLVIIDEACQATELDCLIPHSLKIHRMVFVGDPQQLPATVLSTEALRCQFGMSLFERWFRCFESEGLLQRAPPPVAMLTMQYRMHPEICYFPNVQFYRNMLQSATCDSTLRCAVWPYIFFDLRKGREQESQGSRSIVNHLEAEFLSLLVNFIKMKDKSKSIGIVTPYAAQRSVLERKMKDFQGVEVGTIDGFQGREKDIVLISCVRAQNPNGRIGFVANKQRMNVAITRAKYSLMIIGHASSLESDSDWSSLLSDASRRGMLRSVDDDRAERWRVLFNEVVMRNEQ